MNYFAVQVKTREEAKFVSLAGKLRAAVPLGIVFPRRTLSIRRMGRLKQKEEPLFPGYVFLVGDEVPTEVYWRIKRIPGFFRFLRSNRDIRPVEGTDREILLHFLGFGEVIKKSKVRFDENARIQVVEGPLTGLEGRIVKIDRRKGRAKIKLDMYDDTFLVDLGIDILGETAEGGHG
jgi:transcriptional antiterminator NusG